MDGFSSYDGAVGVPLGAYRPVGVGAFGRGIPWEVIVGMVAFAMTYPVGGPEVPAAQANEPGGMIPFRRATTFRTQQIDATTIASPGITAAQQNVEITVQG